MHLDGTNHHLGEGWVVGDEDRLGRGVVLGLGQQVGRNPGGIVGPIGQRACVLLVLIPTSAPKP